MGHAPWIPLLLFFLLASTVWWIWRPEAGLWWRWQRRRSLTVHVLREDIVKQVHLAELNGRPADIAALAGALRLGRDRVATLVAALETESFVRSTGDGLRLTHAGRELALHLIRAHRLWERHLADETGYAPAEWHARADAREHHLTRSDVADLSRALGNPTHDPHGDPIPSHSGVLPPDGHMPLSAAPLNTPLLVTHVEDEPQSVYAHLAAEGIHPGSVAWVLERSAQRVRFWVDGEEHLVAPVVAGNISVQPLPPNGRTPASEPSLADVPPGESARVLKLSPACRGAERRRLLDLGVLPGTEIAVEMVSPSGDPTAYRIRGSLIALRREQARLISVSSPDRAEVERAA